MKYLTLVICLICLVACADGKKEDSNAEVQILENPTAQSDLEKGTETAGNGVLNSSAVPLYNFEQLEERYLKNNNDTTYVVNFWATWCKPCVEEMPAFETVNSSYKDEKLKVILVSLDFPEKLKSLVIPFIDRKKIRSKVVLLDDPDANSWIPKTSDQWSGAIPATVVVKNGKAAFHEGTMTLEQLEKQIKTIL